MGFYVDMIDVGEGDAFLLSIEGNQGDLIVLVDGGPPSQGEMVAEYIKKNANGTAHIVVATHLDLDHIGGLKDVVTQSTVHRFFVNVPGQTRPSLRKFLRRKLLEGHTAGGDRKRLEKNLETANDLVAALEKKGLDPELIQTGWSWPYGDTVLMALNPTPQRLAEAWAEILVEEDEQRTFAKAFVRTTAPDTSPENNSSVILQVSYKRQPYALMAGDAGADVIREVTAGQTYRFLKVSHHGSKTGLDAQLATQFKGSTAFIPVGDNPHGHPDTEVLELLHRNGAKTYCSQRTRNCWRDCPATGFGNLCLPVDRDLRPNWSTVDPNKCANNR